MNVAHPPQKKHSLFEAFDCVYFTDGACSKNPGPGGWAFVFADFKDNRAEEGAGFAPSTTNNRMELEAVRFSLEHFAKQDKSKRALILLDSDYVRRGLTEWLPNWKKKNWIKSDGQAVLNKEFWIQIEAAMNVVKERVDFYLVPGHAGVAGNDRADELAVAFTHQQSARLYAGPLANYSVNLSEGLRDNLAKTTGVAGPSKKSALQKRAGSGQALSGPKYLKPIYLSYVGGQLLRHQSWADCELRVKGKAGAKFKKVNSKAEEISVLNAWGLTPT